MREKREAGLQVVISAYVAEEAVKGASHVYKIPTDVLRYLSEIISLFQLAGWFFKLYANAGGKMTR